MKNSMNNIDKPLEFRIDKNRPVRVTERREFRSCRRKWFLSYVQELTPNNEIAQADALYLGSGGHYALEKFYREQMESPGTLLPLLPLWDEYVTAEDIKPDHEQDQMMRGVLENYYNFVLENDSKWKVLDVERRFTVEIPGCDALLTGAFDLIMENTEDNSVWIWDHKFLSQLPQPRHLEMDDQVTAYIWIAKKIGLRVRGLMYNAIKKKAPKSPRVLVSGKLSCDKSQDTTHDLFLDKINELGLKTSDYQDMLDFLKHKPDNFLMREPLTRNSQELKHFEEILRMEISEMSNPDTFIYPNPGYHCSWCSFQPLCKMMSEGSNTKLAVETMYRKKFVSEK